MRAGSLGIVLSLALVGCSETFFGFENTPPPGRPLDGGVSFERDGGPLPGGDLAALGQALFFDPELSGNRNIACATCHIPFLTTSDGLALPLGEGATGLGPARARGEGSIVARNTQDLFVRGDPEASRLFWDGRVERDAIAGLVGPVEIPLGVTEPLQLASILPLLDRDEMRGHAGESSFDGRPNELAELDDEDALTIWEAICDRLQAIPAYVELFGGGEIEIHEVAQALDAFQRSIWGDMSSPFDFDTVPPGEATRGRDLFFGDAGCSRCHGGRLLSDMQFHNLAVPQLGPGLAHSGLDEGRARVTHAAADRFRFRTPPLRNVALTPPYMHNGAYATLEDAIRHHFDPVGSLEAYDGDPELPPTLRATLVRDEATLAALSTNVADSAPLRPLSESEVRFLVAFLGALTTSHELARVPEDGVPESVPSGLPFPRWTGPHPFR